VRPRLPLAAQLLLAASVLLLLPWASVPFAARLRQAAVEAQQEALAATASRAAAVLSQQPQPLLPDDGPGTRVVRLLDLTQPVVVDGERSDWTDEAVEPMRLPEPADEDAAPPPFSAVVRLGTRGGGVYALVEVRDPLVVLRDSATGAPGDRLEISVVTADDEWLRFDVDAAADGPVAAWLRRADGARLPDNRVEGTWRTAEGGYTVELRLPRTLVGSRLAIAVVDVEDPQSPTAAARLETSGTESRDAAAVVAAPPPAAAALLEGLAGPATRLWLVDTGKHVVAQSGALAPPVRADLRWPASWLVRALGPLPQSVGTGPSAGAATGTAPPGLSGSAVDRALSGEAADGRRAAGEAVVLSAAHPVQASGRVRGVVLMEQAARDAIDGPIARRLASFVALATLGSVLLLAFATVLSIRLRRLGAAVESLAEDTRSSPASLPQSGATDEVGDLARGLARLSGRQREHAAYLEQVGRRLSHEMRTPVGVVRTSLDNLRLTGVPDAGRVYLDRADEGVRRLSVVLSRLSEATRLEQSLAATERETYDLVPVVRGSVEGHRASSPGREIALRAPDAPLLVSGSPELVAQLLDKLVDNALGFARAGTAVEVDVTGYGRAAALSVRNEGPLLPAEMEGRLFDSMVSIRPATPAEAAPHLGLGLYIVRLVAEFHGGSAAAHDRPDGRGVIVTVTLPLAPARVRS
jgi:two-component system sensor histidine kinase ChvG